MAPFLSLFHTIFVSLKSSPIISLSFLGFDHHSMFRPPPHSRQSLPLRISTKMLLTLRLLYVPTQREYNISERKTEKMVTEYHNAARFIRLCGFTFYYNISYEDICRNGNLKDLYFFYCNFVRKIIQSTVNHGTTLES